MSRLIQTIISNDDELRNQSLEEHCAIRSFADLRADSAELDRFWRTTDNLYHRVRALLFLSAIHRYFLPSAIPPSAQAGKLPYHGYQHLLGRRFTEAIDSFLDEEVRVGPSEALSSGLSRAYHFLAFQTLADQVRRSVRTVRGNQWMFRTGHPDDHPLRVRPELLSRSPMEHSYPTISETTAVRMDFSHAAWSDIFFLGMDYPSGARVINASIDLGVVGRDDATRSPIECYFRVIDEPVLRLVSIDLKSFVDISSIPEVFDFARDYLGLLKAAVIASGIVPPGMEGCELSMEALLRNLVGPGRGIELVSKVNDIPKGSRLAVSTNLLGGLISVCMRATGQVESLSGSQIESDRRLIAARAILGEWIGGSGGGWQDSGGVWPGIKLIQGTGAVDGDPEFGISRGRLLPIHQVLDETDVSLETRQALQDSLVLVHGGMAQNVGPILEMVTEKYLLRSPEAWSARQQAIGILDKLVAALRDGDIREVGRLTHQNFFGPLQKIIPWSTNAFTNSLVKKATEKYGDRFWGFWMLGGMSGGGMGFIFDPHVKHEAQNWLQRTLKSTKDAMSSQLPFAMEPVVYDFSINDNGTFAQLKTKHATMPKAYYALMVPEWLRRARHSLSPLTRRELEHIGAAIRDATELDDYKPVIENILPAADHTAAECDDLDGLLTRIGFDSTHHEQIRSDLRSGRNGLAQNRMPVTTSIEDVEPDDITDARNGLPEAYGKVGSTLLKADKVAVVTLAAGVGSRWTEGAGVVKGIHPFCQFQGQHRTFLETHLAKSRTVGESQGAFPTHIITTGYLTHDAIERKLKAKSNYGYPGEVVLSPGRHVGLRLVPMVRDLQFAWQETAQQLLDEQQEKVRASQRAALMDWARKSGEGTDYRDNAPTQCLHPVGHWYEVPNMMVNGTLAQLLKTKPHLEYLMLHNVDTLGVSLDERLLGWHAEHGGCLSFEVIARRIDDRGGGLARVNGRPRLVEGLALPREEDEFKLSFYNSMTTWITIDAILDAFGISRNQLHEQEVVAEAVRSMSYRMPTYITLKDVKKRWGHGQEDVFPVAQFEKLWSDMTSMSNIKCNYIVVSQQRGQQLKQQSQLDGWLRDGSADYVDALATW